MSQEKLQTTRTSGYSRPFRSTALQYAIACQKYRRNLTDKEIYALTGHFDEKKQQGERTDLKRDFAQPCAKSKSAGETAKKVGVSERKVEQIRTIREDAPESVKEAVEKGEMSINRAYELTQGASGYLGAPKAKDIKDSAMLAPPGGRGLAPRNPPHI